MQMFREPVEGNTKPNTQLVEIRFKTNTDSNVKSLCAGYGTPDRLAMVTKEWEVEIDPGDADLKAECWRLKRQCKFYAKW